MPFKHFLMNLKTLRSVYIPTLKEKVPSLQEKAFKTLKVQPNLLQNQLGKLLKYIKMGRCGCTEISEFIDRKLDENRINNEV